MLPWKILLPIQRRSPLPIYLQIANGLIRGIKQGVVKPGLKLPGTREMAAMLGIHRKTAVQAYGELEAQGWIGSRRSKGSFVSEKLPETRLMNPETHSAGWKDPGQTGYSVRINTVIKSPSQPLRHIPGFHDGPDMRLVPLDSLSATYRNVLKRRTGKHNLSYVNGDGRMLLKKVLSDDMNMARGMNTTPENIFITRGSQMGLYLVAAVTISLGDIVIAGQVDYYYACKTFENAGAKLVRVPVDEDGLDVDQIERICKKQKVRAVYVTAHHHYPTTVTLSAARRMKLLSLAGRYGIILVEDDYDYEFHYHSNPILPLASGDGQGMVVYLGTLSKSLAPAIRTGYVAAPRNLILEMGRLRQIIDVQGDPIMEQAVAELFVEGEIRRHMKKALKEYRQRRDLMCGLLKDKLGNVIDFKVPEGGLAIWAKFDRKVQLPELSRKMMSKGIILSSGLIHDPPGKKLNCTRMGFGWMNRMETEKAVDILHRLVLK